MCVKLISAVFFCSAIIGPLLLSLLSSSEPAPRRSSQRVPPPSPFIGCSSSTNASLPSADLLYAPSATPLCIPFAVLLKTGTEINHSTPPLLFLSGFSNAPGLHVVASQLLPVLHPAPSYAVPVLRTFYNSFCHCSIPLAYLLTPRIFSPPSKRSPWKKSLRSFEFLIPAQRDTSTSSSLFSSSLVFIL